MEVQRIYGAEADDGALGWCTTGDLAGVQAAVRSSRAKHIDDLQKGVRHRLTERNSFSR